MVILILRESDDARVALVPKDAEQLVQKNGFEVCVQKGAGIKAGFVDEAYEKVGAKIIENTNLASCKPDIVCAVEPKVSELTGILHEGSALVGFLNPLGSSSLKVQISSSGAHAYAMELIPRISRAQAMDALSSQANLAGYKAVLLATHYMTKAMPMMMTAAGTISPARVLIVGAGVAGLSAIATAKRLGAVVYAYDVREAVKEQIESLGAKWVNIALEESGEGEGGYAKAVGDSDQKAQQLALGEFAARMDLVITTAQIPGREAPRLLLAESVEKMKPGSVVLDMAASSGGNVEGSKVNEVVETGGAMVLGPSDLPSQMAHDASQVFSKNIVAFLGALIADGKAQHDSEDEILTAARVG